MKPARGRLAEDFPKGSGVPRYVRAKLREDGRVTFPQEHSSGQLYSLSGCNCFAVIPEGDAPAAGTDVELYLFE